MSTELEKRDLLFSGNTAFLEELYQLYSSDPSSVDDSWQEFFKNFYDPNFSAAANNPQIILGSTKQNENSANIKNYTKSYQSYFKSVDIINSYRRYGHFLAKLDPLGLELTKNKAELGLDIDSFELTDADLASTVELRKVFGGLGDISGCTLQELIKLLEKIYSSSIAVEFSHVTDIAEQNWLWKEIEQTQLDPAIDVEKQLGILNSLIEVETFEQYIHTKFPGAKRFSIEGGESSIVALEQIIQNLADSGTKEVIIGMAHRGRLSTLTKVLHKPYKAVLSEFMGGYVIAEDSDISGDVKYHMGYECEYSNLQGHKIQLSINPNPSHLEAVNAVVAGKVRGKQDLQYNKQRKNAVSILIHGDAAFCGQGVVTECLSMSNLPAYTTGGILHIIINNQIGFTANSWDTRGSRYPTEPAKIIAAPILHVNGDDVEAVVRAAEIAVRYQQNFGKDIVLDIVCYRKYGHNEGDEPMYTQGEMYNIIKNKKSPAELYANHLASNAAISDNYLTESKTKFKASLDAEYEQAKQYQPKQQQIKNNWSAITRSSNWLVTTGVKASILLELGKKLCQTSTDFPINPKLEKLLEQRLSTLNNNAPIDWATAEQLAFASLLVENIPVRLTGQDSGRGTFSHRHSVLHSQIDNKEYIPLNHLAESQATYFVADSNLSEYGVLGFEYGYSLVTPHQLVLWEAQFGDFANGAQIIFDQFIAASETKWLSMSGLVVLLPHGYEGQGPEHSSARLERFLSLAAEDNIQVVYPTTPASFFHLLRRQLYSTTRKPLIVMTPKSLLRHKLAVSNITTMDVGTYFLPVLAEIDESLDAKKISRVVVCSGKVYYDLLELRSIKDIKNTVIIRIEQLYPFIEEEFIRILSQYPNASEFIWCQEEPKNMGAWIFIRNYLDESLNKIKNKAEKIFRYAGRKESASPAVGYLSLHNKQQEMLLKDALNIK